MVVNKKRAKIASGCNSILHFWKKRFLKKVANYQKRRDHYHFTGKYRGAGHSTCNLRFMYLTKFL